MTPFDPPPAPPADETDWLAARYVLGELSAGEAAAFEDRLAADQSAREAVARATRLVEALAATPWPEQAAPARPRRVRRLVAALAATAAAILVGVVAYRGADDARRNGRGLAADEVDPARLVVLWSASADALNGLPEAEPSDDLSSAEAESALLPPDWMLAAVEQEAWPSPVDPALDADPAAIERN